LQMISQNEGFVLSHPEVVTKKDSSIRFGYHRLYYSEGKWHKNWLFYFEVPLALLAQGPERIYESILPMLPTICQDQIYYVDSSGTDFLQLCVFDMNTQESKKIVSNHTHIFGLQPHDQGILFYGGQLEGEIAMVEGVKMSLGILPQMLT
jgi:hypothetical protein